VNDKLMGNNRWMNKTNEEIFETINE